MGFFFNFHKSLAVALKDLQRISSGYKPSKLTMGVTDFDTWWHEKFRYMIVGKFLQEAESNFRYFAEYVEGVVAFAKFRWNKYEFDSSFPYYCLRFGLSRLKGCLVRHSNAARDKHRIRICELLIDRILKDEYADDGLEAHDKKWGKVHLKFEGNDSELTRSLLTKRDNVITGKDEELERKEFLTINERAQARRQADKEYLYKLLYKHLDSWWD